MASRVGVDGSDVSRAALEVALGLGTRLNAALTAVIARGATSDVQVSADTVDAVHIDEREPVGALLDAAGTSDLLVLGPVACTACVHWEALASASLIGHRPPSWSFGMP